MTPTQKLIAVICVSAIFLIVLALSVWMNTFEKDQKREYTRLDTALKNALNEFQLHALKKEIESFRINFADDEKGNKMYKDLCMFHSELQIEWEELIEILKEIKKQM